MKTIILLTISNVFMTFAWYGHLKFRESPLWLAILMESSCRVRIYRRRRILHVL